MLRIEAFPRVHITLIGMNCDGYRINGGIGFSIASPMLEMSFKEADYVEVEDKRCQGFTQDELNRLTDHLRRVKNQEKLDLGFVCTIHEGVIESHVGFGSNSIIYLSCVEALLKLNHREYTENNVMALSGRGGTSGIGINTYFKGGFIFDTGIVNNEHRVLAPSSVFMNEEGHQPLLMKSLRLPQWDLGICIPDVARNTEDEERQFFQANCPIEKSAAEDVLYEAVYGITSSLMENDFEVFCQSIDAIQSTKWKSLERNLYGENLLNAEAVIKNAGAKCVGMSSLGPMLYFFGEDMDGIVGKVNQEMPEYICFKTSFNNSGRVVEDD